MKQKPKDIVEQTIEERGKVYGDPKLSHECIGLAWTAILRRHWDMRVAVIPPEIVALMLMAMKTQRSTRVYYADNYIDMDAYRRFAESFQKEQS